MLTAMSLRRVPPLPVALVLVALALIAAAWTTRSTVVDAYAAVRDGQAFAAQQSVRADLADLGAPPTVEQLDAIVRDRATEGVRYIAVHDGRRLVAEAGTSTVEAQPVRRRDRRGVEIQHAGDRIRIAVAAPMRRAWAGGARATRIVLEVEPSQALALRSAATRTLLVGAVAALLLLGVAAWLVRGELRRRAHERERERERRLASLGEMSAVLAHEIRNPLASLKGNAQLLAASLPAGDKPRAKAERVVDEAIRLERLTQDLLAFVRTGELVRAPVELAALARGAAAAVGGDVEVSVDNAPPTWSLDQPRMHQVLVNLLENAVAAGPPARIDLRGQRGVLVIEVSDKGPGVPAEERDKVFEPFFTNKKRGTGLGLAIARRIVEHHRGTLSVDDAPGGGARFRIEIPEA
jgi:two-component system, NtrC family, sensor histidine kinase HydH